jgi:phosphoribosylpyrophosphate synthetase
MGDENSALQRLLVRRVGGFFRNTVREVGRTCSVCCGPSPQSALCSRCAGHRAEFGEQLADNVFILTYVRGRQGQKGIHQSAHTVRAYKQSPPAAKCADDMALMVRAATTIHADCIERRSGGPWSVVTFVSSQSRPVRRHPVAELARQVSRNNNGDNRILLDPGPGFEIQPERTVRPDRFTVSAEFRERIQDRNVLLIEDTWATGSKLQSAAVALHDAGAKIVTALCVARWCNDNWPDHKELLDSCADPYDALVCPTTGGSCP